MAKIVVNTVICWNHTHESDTLDRPQIEKLEIPVYSFHLGTVVWGVRDLPGV